VSGAIAGMRPAVFSLPSLVPPRRSRFRAGSTRSPVLAMWTVNNCSGFWGEITRQCTSNRST
jgi:hypothetical protein